MTTAQKPVAPKTDPKPDDTNESPDVQAANAAGLSEGEIKALRHESGLNQGAGHEADVAAWEASEDGKAFLATEKDRVKEDEKAAKATRDNLDDDGKSESEKKYIETVKG